MADRSCRIVGQGSHLSRRRWLAASLLGGLGLSARAEDPHGPAEHSGGDLAPVLAKARAARLRDFEAIAKDHYLVVGDAPRRSREQAMAICRALAATYEDHFQDRGLPVTFPPSRMTVVVLKDRRSYEKYVGERAELEVGGHYDLNSNQLVIFDLAADAEDLAAPASRVNTFTLVHEAVHQLTYNTGLLDRRADVPVAISEGLATYAEIWRPPPARSTFGATNHSRLEALVQPSQDEDPGARDPWIPLPRLLTKDDLFQGANTRQRAYGQAWVLVHSLLSRPRVRSFHAYLKAIRERRDPSDRLKDAKRHLGDLAALDRELKKEARKALRA